MKEGQTQTMQLDGVEPEVFGVLVHWIYYQTIEEEQIADKEQITHIDVGKLGKIWVLAERLMMPTFQNRIMDRLHLALRTNIISEIKQLIKLAYEGRDGDNPLAKVIIWAMCWMEKKKFDYLVDYMPQSMALDVVRH